MSPSPKLSHTLRHDLCHEIWTLRQLEALLFLEMMVAERGKSLAWRVRLNVEANNGSSIFTTALASVNDRVGAGIWMLWTGTLNPSVSRVLASFSGVVTGSIPVMHATEKSVGRETLITFPNASKYTDAPAKSRIRSSSGSCPYGELGSVSSGRIVSAYLIVGIMISIISCR